MMGTAAGERYAVAWILDNGVDRGQLEIRELPDFFANGEEGESFAIRE